MSIGTFTLVKNEIAWIREHIENVAPYVAEMMFFDGNSTDGTLEILRQAAKDYPSVIVYEDKDPENLLEDYTKVFDECLHALGTDLAVFLHPDMWIENPEQLLKIADSKATAMFSHMTSYAGNPGGKLYRVDAGRAHHWKNIYRLRSPDLGAHYHGFYGAMNEDVYFRNITGDGHSFFGANLKAYPYEVEDSGLKIHHFSDVRTYGRRLGRMRTVLENQGCESNRALLLAQMHPRVTLEGHDRFKFVECKDPRREQVHA